MLAGIVVTNGEYKECFCENIFLIFDRLNLAYIKLLSQQPRCKRNKEVLDRSFFFMAGKRIIPNKNIYQPYEVSVQDTLEHETHRTPGMYKTVYSVQELADKRICCAHTPCKNVQWSSGMNIVCSPVDNAVYEAHHPGGKLAVQDTSERKTGEVLADFIMIVHQLQEVPVQSTETLARHEGMHNKREFTGKNIYSRIVPCQNVQWSSNMNIVCSPVDDVAYETVNEPRGNSVQDTLEHNTGKALTECIVTGQSEV